MSTLKHITGILLATVGVMVTLGTFVVALHPDHKVSLQMIGVVFFVLGLIPLAAAFALLRAKLAAPSRPCPLCGSPERQPAGILRKSRNPWLFHFGGWLLPSLWGASRQEQVRCVQCDHLYMTDTRSTRIAGVLVWVFILVMLAGILLQQLERR